MAVSLPVAATMYASCTSDLLRPVYGLAFWGVFVCSMRVAQRTNPCLIEIDYETILDLQQSGFSVEALTPSLVAGTHMKSARSTYGTVAFKHSNRAQDLGAIPSPCCSQVPRTRT
jgi:hypothetical protein